MKTLPNNENNINLIVLEKSHGTRIQGAFNPLAPIIKNKIKGNKREHLAQDNIHLPHPHYQMVEIPRIF